MLTISKALSSGQAQSYHKLEFTSETQNYYKQGETVKGEWQGKLAASLRLSGEVALEFVNSSQFRADQQHFMLCLPETTTHPQPRLKAHLLVGL